MTRKTFYTLDHPMPLDFPLPLDHLDEDLEAALEDLMLPETGRLVPAAEGSFL